jgi:hypothetical protein
MNTRAASLEAVSGAFMIRLSFCRLLRDLPGSQLLYEQATIQNENKPYFPAFAAQIEKVLFMYELACITNL